ncbi:MAG: hypothetical protein E7646_05900 [Ruminococcaceae bacterium]|nr:hypothetical protein [Oscillospiraceae bacterium]
MLKLYGDGIHDDWAAIQELIDSGKSEIVLPAPEKNYLISKPLILPSNFRLVLPRFAHIRLMDGANCVMVRNKMVPDPKKRLSPEVYQSELQAHIWGYVDDYSPDAPCENVELCGGIWDCNNLNQLPNPERTKEHPVREHYGCGMLFYNVKNFKLSSLTVKDPSQYAIAIDGAYQFTVEDITFDFNDGNPYPINMDGIHLDGNCHYGVIRNLKGTCYDDMVAINAHEGSRGDITDILIDGIFAQYCHSAVRLLAVNERVENIHITNVYGSFYQYVLGLTKHYPGEVTGVFDGIFMDKVYATKAMPVTKGDFVWPPAEEARYNLPFVYIQRNTLVRNLVLRDIERKERTLPIDTVRIGENAVVERFIIENFINENYTGQPMSFIKNDGLIKYLHMTDVVTRDCERITGGGKTEKLIED